MVDCGGCSLDGDGQDCTAQFDGEVQCVAGECVAQASEILGF
jgi:hypothetical protein